ncbi:12950_t:CDS:2, partial [Dentiscutata erythropus]
DALEHQKTWLIRDCSKNKGLAIKTLKQQLQWYEANSFDKEKTKAIEILGGLPEFGL